MMNRWCFAFLLSIAMWSHVVDAASGPPQASAPGIVRFSTPKPKYPRTAKEARIEGSGVVRVTFDATGKPTHAEMIQSTGSLILDKNTTMTAEQYWTTSGGKPATKTVIVDYRLPPLLRTQKTPVAVPPHTTGPFFAPHPAYPSIARQHRTTGRLIVRVTYGALGGPVQTELLQKSGSDLLDGYTADFIRLHWKCYNEAPTVHTTTIDYTLR